MIVFVEVAFGEDFMFPPSANVKIGHLVVGRTQSTGRLSLLSELHAGYGASNAPRTGAPAPTPVS